MTAVTIHMKSGKNIFVKTDSPSLTSRLETIVIGSCALQILSIRVGQNCERIFIKPTNYQKMETSTVWLKTSEVEFVQFDVPTSQDS